MFEIGQSIQDITPPVDGTGMMGWGQFGKNVAYAAETPLKVRTFVFNSKKSRKKIAYVCAEIAFTTISIKEGVIEELEKNYPELGFNDENVMISATHTHSAPGGYSQYMLYNITIPGFIKDVYDKYVKGIVQSIVEADKNIQKGKIFINKGEISPEKNVAFNRSIPAYNENPEVKKVTEDQKHIAIDREMTLLKMESEKGQLIGMTNWFAVHCTNIHSDNHLITPDNKGYASIDFEKYIKTKYDNDKFIGIFAQSACGDVTPNFQYFPKMKFLRGQYIDDFKSARFNGEIQSEKAKELFEDKSNLKELNDNIDYVHMYVDFSHINISEKFTNGIKEQKTGSAAIGVSMLMGTLEGPGITENVGAALGLISKGLNIKDKISSVLKPELKKRLKKQEEVHGNKMIFLESGEKRVLGFDDIKNLIIPNSVDPLVQELKILAENDAFGKHPWTPNILPLQILILGELAIVGIPAEVTTISGKRIKNTVLNVLSKKGIKEIVLSCYTNAYSGYITTKEEYEVQLYEGGSTHFGKWTLAAYQTNLEILAEQLLKEDKDREKTDLKPHKVSHDLLELQTKIHNRLHMDDKK